MDNVLHSCWFIESWQESRNKYLLAWQKLGWQCVLWTSGQVVEAPVPGVKLRNVDEIVKGSIIEEIFNMERYYGSHASCADLFRYFLLWQVGGTYADIDVLPDPQGEVMPSWLFVAQPVFGIPNPATKLALEIRFIRAPVQHELLYRLVEKALKNEQRFIDKGGYRALRNTSIIERTGPAMATQVVREYAEEKGLSFESFLIRATFDSTLENSKGQGNAMGFVRAIEKVAIRKEYPGFPGLFGTKKKTPSDRA